LAQGTVIKSKQRLSFFSNFKLPKKELQASDCTEVSPVVGANEGNNGLGKAYFRATIKRALNQSQKYEIGD
jgi:hypothetical protein